MGCVSIPNDKLQRLHAVISTALKGKYTDHSTLSKLCGMLQWLFKLSPLAKPWLRALYLDLNTPRATNFSVRQNEWQAFVSCLSETLHLIQLPAGAAVTVGSKVLAVRHRKVKTKQDLLHCNLGDKDIWLRIADPASKRRSLSPASKALLHFWLGWSQLPPLWRALRPQQHVAVEAAADAMGKCEIFAIGGYISLASEFWFSEKFTVADLHLLLYLSNLRPIAISAAMSALVRLHWFGCLAYCIHAVAFQFRMHSWCDNTGAESAANKMFTSCLATCSFHSETCIAFKLYWCVHLDVQHIAGPKNKDADYLSRWLENTPLAARWQRTFRRRLFASPALACRASDFHFTSILETRFSAAFWFSIRRGFVNPVAQLHLVELMRDLGSLAVFTFGGDMQIHCCFKVFFALLHSSDLHFPPENKKEVCDRVTASIPFSSIYILEALYICILCIYKAAI